MENSRIKKLQRKTALESVRNEKFAVHVAIDLSLGAHRAILAPMKVRLHKLVLVVAHRAAGNDRLRFLVLHFDAHRASRIRHSGHIQIAHFARIDDRRIGSVRHIARDYVDGTLV